LTASELGSRYRELIAWNTEQRVAVEQRLATLCRQWCIDWALPTSIREADPGARHSTIKAEEAKKHLSIRLFGQGSGSVDLAHVSSTSIGLAESLCSQAWTDWMDRLQKTLGLSRDQLLEAIQPVQLEDVSIRTDCWSGQMRVAIGWWGSSWELDLPARSVRHVLGLTETPGRSIKPSLAQYPPLVSIDAAAARQSIQLNVELQAVRLSLGDIGRLQVGDVISLGHRLDQAASVFALSSSGEARPLCTGWLGQCDGQVAVHLNGAS